MKHEENINTIISEVPLKHKVALSVDCVILGYDENSLKVLLVECNTPPFSGMFSLLGELVEPNETLDEAAHRVLGIWTGQESLYLEEVKTFSNIKRHPLARVITVAYYSLVEIERFEISDLKMKNLKWVDVNEVDVLAFDHNSILEECLMRLRRRLRERPIGFNLLPDKFSLNQLQNLYEVVLGIDLDKRNFRRKIMSLDILIDLNETQQDVSHRPAKLFSFDYAKYKKKKSKGFKFEV